MDIAKAIKEDCGMPTDIAFAVSEKKRQARSSTLKEVVGLIDKLGESYFNHREWDTQTKINKRATLIELKSKILALEQKENKQ